MDKYVAIFGSVCFGIISGIAVYTCYYSEPLLRLHNKALMEMALDDDDGNVITQEESDDDDDEQ